MNIGDMIKLASPSPRPQYVIYYITSRCNAKCNFCSNYQWVNAGADESRELNLDEIKLLARNLRPLFQLSISGGEPFLRQDLAEAAEIWQREARVRTLSLPTNASMPDRIESVLARLLPKIADTQVTVYISVDGVGAVHDRIRGFPGLFERALQSHEILSALREKYSNLLVYLNITVQKENAGKLDEVFDFFRGDYAVDGAAMALVRGRIPDPALKDVDLDTMERIQKRYRKFLKECLPGHGKRIRNAVLVSSMEYLDVYHRTGKMPLPCHAGGKLIVIGSDGEVKPCEMLDYSFGNLREVNFDIGRLINSEKARIFRDTTRKGCECDWECGARADVVFSPGAWPRIASRMIWF